MELSSRLGTTSFRSLISPPALQPWFSRGTLWNRSTYPYEGLKVVKLEKLETARNTFNPGRALIILAAASGYLYLRGSMAVVGLFGDALLNQQGFPWRIAQKAVAGGFRARSSSLKCSLLL
jgi:hypothetical protein